MASRQFNDNGFPLERLPSSAPVWDNPQPNSERQRNRDEEELARFGKKQQLRRNFGLISIIALTCTLMITWEGFLATFQNGLSDGGPSGLVYGYLFTWFGNILQIIVLAEMASMIPVSGGQYNWVAILAPRSCSKFLSYLTGWMTVLTWQASLASSAFLGGTMIQGLLIQNYPDYNMQRWHGTLLFYAIIAMSLFINVFVARLLPTVEALVLIVHIVGFFGILIPLLYLAPHSPTLDVFASFTNQGGWNTTGLSFFVGLSTSQFAFVGIDAASHMAEEIERASTVIPTSMIASVLLNGSLGFAMVIAVLFCLGDEDTAVNSPTGFPFIAVFQNATQSHSGSSAMSAIVIMAMIFATIGFLATASRMTWAFAREKGLPFSHILAKVEPQRALPVYSIALTTVTSLVLALINIGSSTAFNALISLVICGFYFSFLISASVLLYKRIITPRAGIEFGPFSMGRAGIPLICSAIAYSLIAFFFSFWPPSVDPSPGDMNWAIAVFGGVFIFSLLFWVLHGRKIYRGPVLELMNK